MSSRIRSTQMVLRIVVRQASSSLVHSVSGVALVVGEQSWLHFCVHLMTLSWSSSRPHESQHCSQGSAHRSKK
jgi:hypothetical protein